MLIWRGGGGGGGVNILELFLKGFLFVEKEFFFCFPFSNFQIRTTNKGRARRLVIFNATLTLSSTLSIYQRYGSIVFN